MVFSWLLSLISASIFFLLLCLTFDIKQFPDLLQCLFLSFTLSFSLLLWYILWHSFSEHSVHIYWVPDTVVGTGEMTVNKTNNIFAFVELLLPFFFFSGIFIQFQDIFYPISTGTHPNRFGTHVRWRNCFISFPFLLSHVYCATYWRKYYFEWGSQIYTFIFYMSLIKSFPLCEG